MVSCATRHLHCNRNRYLGSWLDVEEKREECKKQPPYCDIMLLVVLHYGFVLYQQTKLFWS